MAGYFNLARLWTSAGGSHQLRVFPGADNLNPVIDTAGNLIFCPTGMVTAIFTSIPLRPVKYQLTDLITRS